LLMPDLFEITLIRPHFFSTWLPSRALHCMTFALQCCKQLSSIFDAV
jgi:hypothetical protein